MTLSTVVITPHTKDPRDYAKGLRRLADMIETGGFADPYFVTGGDMVTDSARILRFDFLPQGSSSPSFVSSKENPEAA